MNTLDSCMIPHRYDGQSESVYKPGPVIITKASPEEIERVIAAQDSKPTRDSLGLIIPKEF